MTVLIADDDLFEAGYVATVLEARGICVVGPFADLGGALAAIEGGDLRAAVIAQPVREPRTAVVDALEQRGIPYLTLYRPTLAPRLPEDRPVLCKPFAAYQVAEWVVQAAPSEVASIRVEILLS